MRAYAPLSAVQQLVAAEASDAEAEDDVEIVAEPARISLVCPISLQRIGLPVRGATCTHLDVRQIARRRRKTTRSNEGLYMLTGCAAGGWPRTRCGDAVLRLERLLVHQPASADVVLPDMLVRERDLHCADEDVLAPAVTHAGVRMGPKAVMAVPSKRTLQNALSVDELVLDMVTSFPLYALAERLGWSIEAGRRVLTIRGLRGRVFTSAPCRSVRTVMLNASGVWQASVPPPQRRTAQPRGRAAQLERDLAAMLGDWNGHSAAGGADGPPVPLAPVKPEPGAAPLYISLLSDDEDAVDAAGIRWECWARRARPS